MQHRLLLVPEFTELEWSIAPLLAEWAEIATYDPPGVGEKDVSDEELERLANDPVYRRERSVERGLEEIERLGWDTFTLVSDSGANFQAGRIAESIPERIRAVALGHACLRIDWRGERPTLNPEIVSAMTSLVENDHEQFLQHALTQLTGGAYGEELSRGILERVPTVLFNRDWLSGGEAPIKEMLAGLDVPMLLVKHEGCLMYTDEGFEDAVAAFPDAQSLALEGKPSVSAEFARELRSFCESLPTT